MNLNDIPKAFALTIIDQIAILLLSAADGDMAEARRAALIAIKAYDPRTEIEFQLAALITSFSLQAMHALAQAANPDLPLTRVLRLRTGAVSLNRQAMKTELQLQKLRKARTLGIEPEATPEPLPVAQTEAPQPEKPEAPQAAPPAEETTAPIGGIGKIAAYAQARGISWSQGMKERNRQKRLAERQAKMARRVAASQAA